MKTLLQINTNIGWNSVGRIAGRIGRAAIESGWNSYIAYGRDPGHAVAACRSQLIRIGNLADRCVHGLATRLADAHGLASRTATIALMRRIDSIAPDVVHLHNIHGYYLNYPLLFDYLAHAGVPVVWTLHDCWPLTGHCAFFDTVGCRRWLSGCGNCPQSRTYPASWAADRSAANFKSKIEAFTSLPRLKLVSVSHWLDGIVGRSALSECSRTVIYNGIDPDRFTIRPSALRRRTAVAAASVWDERKGLDRIVELRRYLPTDIQLQVVGVSEKMSRRLGHGISTLPRLNDIDTLTDVYNSAGVFINPSAGDNLPMVNLEAQACGTPVVCLDTGGMPESVSPQTGRVVPDMRGMAAAVADILDNPGKYSPEVCRRHILDNFDAALSCRKYMELYDQISK